MRPIGRPLFRTLLLTSALILPVLAGRAVPAHSPDSTGERRLRLYHTHTGGRIDIIIGGAPRIYRKRLPNSTTS